MTRRLVVLSGWLLAAAACLYAASRPEEVPLREPLAGLPFAIGAWTGEPLPDFDAAVEALLGADEYVHRAYASAPDRAVALYLGYYSSQRHGDSIHSPLNCLPGSGWQPVSHSYLAIPIESSSIRVNRYVVRKGLERNVVLYWYQSRGRVVASEYWSKLYLIYDALRLNRTDAALVRVIAPVAGSGAAAEAAATSDAVDFVRATFPLLGRYLPS
jgi:EpsI family protein